MNVQELLGKLASGSASQADYQHFTQWFESLSEAEQLQVLQQYESILLQQKGGAVPTALAQKIASQVRAHEQYKQKAKVITIARRYAAAAVLGVLALGITWLVTQSKPDKASSKGIAGKPLVNDKEPASQGATLTLADGSTIVLDSIANGSIAIQGDRQVTKTNGQLSYEASSKRNTGVPGHDNPPVAYNTLVTPRGRQFQLLLPDGTKVWLNAASSIRYPTAFTGRERMVSITGEAYFEVAKIAQQPFKVRFRTPAAGAGEVEVLGTHFNINAYNDEPAIHTTLLEGKVRMAPVDTSSTIPMPGYSLAPGKQAILSLTSHKSPQIQVQTVDLETIMAWKNGRFRFHQAPIKDIMRQVARWYDVDIIYAKPIPEKAFTADLSRQTRLSELLKVLELSGFRFTTDAKTLTVTN